MFQKFYLCVGLMALLFGCAQTVALRTTPAVPAALGQAKVSQDDNGNATIDIEVEHLSPPENLSPAKTVYVVWAQAPQGRVINLGQMIVGNNRVGKFRSVTPLTNFRIVITGEDLPAVASPSQQEIFTTEVFTVN